MLSRRIRKPEARSLREELENYLSQTLAACGVDQPEPCQPELTTNKNYFTFSVVNTSFVHWPQVPLVGQLLLSTQRVY